MIATTMGHYKLICYKYHWRYTEGEGEGVTLGLQKTNIRAPVMVSIHLTQRVVV